MALGLLALLLVTRPTDPIEREPMGDRSRLIST
jgi:hypothetical protein